MKGEIVLGLQIDKSSQVSITRQLTSQIRGMILDGSIKAGEKLPPSRSMASELNISRNVVVEAYEQLISEGYLVGRTGSGTYAVKLKTSDPGQAGNKHAAPRPASTSGEQAFPRQAGHERAAPGQAFPYIKQDNFPGRHAPGREPSETRKHSPGNAGKGIIHFNAGNPDSLLFPRVQWAKLLKEACLDAPDRMFEYGPAVGEWQLRSAISSYLFRAGGVRCDPEQIVIIPGVAAAIDILAGIFAIDTNTVAIEDPSIYFVQCSFRRHGFTVCPVPVDNSGMDVDLLPREQPAGLIYASPSHQFPIGGVLPIKRRLRLLEYANEMDAYVIEDDYDSEFRYQGEPIQPMRHLDPERVIYLKTFSKILSPGLRLGCMVLPERLRVPASDYMERMNIRTPQLFQLAAATFIEEKMLDRHVYKMKKIYERKRNHLIHALKDAFGSGICISGDCAGLHILVTFLDRTFSSRDFRNLLENGIDVDWVEEFAIRKGYHKNKIVLGYGNLSLEQITDGVGRIRRVLGR